MTRNSNYKSLNSLMRHIRDSSGIRIGGGSDKRALAQMGYFHGYKGYRYSGTATKRMNSTFIFLGRIASLCLFFPPSRLHQRHADVQGGPEGVCPSGPPHSLLLQL